RTLDLVTANSDSNALTVLLGNGSGGVGPPGPYPTASFSAAVALGDLNGDGKLDAVTANSDANSVSVLVGKGDGTFAAATSTPVGQSRRSSRSPTSTATPGSTSSPPT